MDPETEDPLDLVQLRASSDDAIKRTQAACEMRLKMLQRVVGPYYPGDGAGSPERRPVNLFELASDTYLRGLASHTPQAIVETDFEELLPTACDFETVLNRKITRIHLKEAINTCATEALFTIGVMCIGVKLDGEDGSEDVFAEPVLFPDLVLDLAAQSWDQQSFVGHEFLVPLEWLQDNPDLTTETRDAFVQWSRDQQYSQGRDWKRIGGIESEEYEKLVRLRQLYLPRHKKIVLFAVDGPVREPLRVSDWTGPYCGPYIPLAFRTVPGNVLPLAPMLALYDLDDFANKAYSKAFRQAERCKTIGLVSGNPDDATNIATANDGEIKNVTDAKSVEEKRFGGADQNVVQAATMAQQLFMYMGGNLELLAGLAASSGTVGQDQLLAVGAQGRMKEMQQVMVEFETAVINSLAYWVWQDPTGEERFTKRLEGTSEGISEVWSPENRSGEFFQYNLSVNPYSRVNRSPSEQGAFITQILQQVLLPSLPYMQQGGPIDWEFFFKMLARYNNAPEINMLINWPDGGGMPQGAPEQPKMPSATSREYIRRNVSGGSTNPLQDAMKAFADSSTPNGQPQPAGVY